MAVMLSAHCEKELLLLQQASGLPLQQASGLPLQQASGLEVLLNRMAKCKE